MKTKRLTIIVLISILFCLAGVGIAQKLFIVKSPDNRINATVSVGDIVE